VTNLLLIFFLKNLIDYESLRTNELARVTVVLAI